MHVGTARFLMKVLSVHKHSGNIENNSQPMPNNGIRDVVF
jgi:hypothetical protein